MQELHNGLVSLAVLQKSYFPRIVPQIIITCNYEYYYISFMLKMLQLQYKPSIELILLCKKKFSSKMEMSFSPLGTGTLGGFKLFQIYELFA